MGLLPRKCLCSCGKTSFASSPPKKTPAEAGVFSVFDYAMLCWERQSATAWKFGATGESKVGAHLEAFAADQIIVLHDRPIPRTRANIDHIVATRAGVWVVDAKRYHNKRPALRVEGGLFRPRVERLIMDGDRTKLVDGVLRQLSFVSDLRGQQVGAVPVTGARRFVDADWPMFGGSFRTRGVEVLWPKKRVQLLAAERTGRSMSAQPSLRSLATSLRPDPPRAPR